MRRKPIRSFERATDRILHLWNHPLAVKQPSKCRIFSTMRRSRSPLHGAQIYEWKCISFQNMHKAEVDTNIIKISVVTSNRTFEACFQGHVFLTLKSNAKQAVRLSPDQPIFNTVKNFIDVWNFVRTHEISFFDRCYTLFVNHTCLRNDSWPSLVSKLFQSVTE